MIADGISGTQYPTAEPYTTAYSDPYSLLKYYLDGYSYGESVFVSQRLLSWQMIIVGDPLMTVTYSDTSIPEPATIVLLVMGIAGLIRRKNGR